MYPITKSSNRTPVIGHPRDCAPITWQISARRTNHDQEFSYRYDWHKNLFLLSDTSKFFIWKGISAVYHITRAARAQFPWKTIREKVPYEGRTCRSDRAGKTRTALLEMCTALLETATAKLMRVNDRNNFVAAKFCSLQNESWKWTFWERILLSRRIVPCRTTSSVANSLRKQRKKFSTPRKWRSAQLSQKPTSKQAVKETTFSDKLSDS